jgi:transcriptional regulator with XRE-family HTH domain
VIANPILGFRQGGSRLLLVDKTIYSQEQAVLVGLLRRLREEAGLRQLDLADQLDRPQSFVSKYEAGERRLDLIELRTIAGALGIGLVGLVEEFERALRPPGHSS